MKSRVRRILTLAVMAIVALFPTQKSLSQTYVRIVHQYDLWKLQQHPNPCEQLHLFRRIPHSDGNPSTPGTLTLHLDDKLQRERH